MAEAIEKVSTKLRRTPLVYSLCQWGWVRYRSTSYNFHIYFDSDMFATGATMALGSGHISELEGELFDSELELCPSEAKWHRLWLRRLRAISPQTGDPSPAYLTRTFVAKYSNINSPPKRRADGAALQKLVYRVGE